MADGQMHKLPAPHSCGGGEISLRPEIFSICERADNKCGRPMGTGIVLTRASWLSEQCLFSLSAEPYLIGSGVDKMSGAIKYTRAAERGGVIKAQWCVGVQCGISNALCV